MFIVVFIHIGLPKVSDEVLEYARYMKNYAESEKITLAALKNYALENDMPIRDYHNLETVITKEFTRIEIEHDNILDQKVDKHRVVGFKSLRVFLIGFGIRSVLLFLAILLFISYYIKDKGLLKIINWAALCFVAQGLFINNWFLLDEADYEPYVYYITISIMSLLGAYLVYKFVRRYEGLIVRLKNALEYAIKRYWKIKKKYIKPEDEKEFVTDVAKTLVKIDEKV